MGSRCYFLALLLGAISVTTAQYLDGPPAPFYGPPIVQQAIVEGSAPLPVVGSYESLAPPSPASGGPFQVPQPPPSAQDSSSPVPVVETLEEVYKSPAIITEIVAAPQSMSVQRPFEAPAAPSQIPFEAPTPQLAPEIPQLNAPAEIYGLPEVVTEIVSAPPSQTELTQTITSVLPQAPAETPKTSSTADLDVPAEITADVAVASKTRQEVHSFESAAPQPQQVAHDILKTSPPVPVYGVPVEAVNIPSPGLLSIEAIAPTPAPTDKPASPPPTPEVNIPANVYGPPTSDNEIVPIPPSPPLYTLPSSELTQASAEVHNSRAVEQEIQVSHPSAPILAPSLLTSHTSKIPAISEFPVQAPETLSHIYGPHIISRKIAEVQQKLLKLQSYIIPIKIRIAAPWIPIPRTFGVPADVYGPPQLGF